MHGRGVDWDWGTGADWEMTVVGKGDICRILSTIKS